MLFKVKTSTRLLSRHEYTLCASASKYICIMQTADSLPKCKHFIVKQIIVFLQNFQFSKHKANLTVLTFDEVFPD